MRYLVYTALCIACFGFASCKKENTAVGQPVNANPFEGGKGGNFSRSFFSGHNGVPIAARMYLKYGDNKMPSDSTKFDEKHDAVREPGFSYHAHFDGLTKGTYFFYAVSGVLQFDTVIVLTDSSELSDNIIVQLN